MKTSSENFLTDIFKVYGKGILVGSLIVAFGAGAYKWDDILGFFSPHHNSPNTPGISSNKLRDRLSRDDLIVLKDLAPDLIFPAATSLNVVFMPEDAFDQGTKDMLLAEVPQIVEYVERRVNQALLGATTYIVNSTVGCDRGGLAYTKDRILNSYTCQSDLNGSFGANKSIFSHELVHQLTEDKYGNNISLYLSEGMATWGAGKYWTGYTEDFRQYVIDQGYKTDEESVFFEEPRDMGVHRNTQYARWASFVQFLLDTYGEDTVGKLWVDPNGYSDFNSTVMTVLSKSRSQIFAEYLAWMNQ